MRKHVGTCIPLELGTGFRHVCPPLPMAAPPQSLADKYPRLRRAAVLFLATGGIVVWLVLKPHIPHDHPVAYRFDPDPASVTDLEASWTRADSPEPVAGARYQWRAGEAPKEVRATVRGPDGEYEVEVTVRSGSMQERSSSRVALGEQITRIRVSTPAVSASAATSSASPGSAPAASPAPSASR